MKIRKPTYSGTFYPDNKDELLYIVNKYIKDGQKQFDKILKPKCLISPHAGYIYSGPIAGSGYYQFLHLPQNDYNVFLIGPSHHVYTDQIHISNFDIYQTPLGNVEINKSICNEILNKYDNTKNIEKAEILEHCLETQIPFLQCSLKKFKIIPILYGDINIKILIDIIHNYFLQENNLFIISSDLSHYLPYDIAVKKDKKTVDIITSYDFENIDEIDGCGSLGIQAMMYISYKYKYKMYLLDLRNSGDTAGDKSKVVGYASIAISNN